MLTQTSYTDIDYLTDVGYSITNIGYVDRYRLLSSTTPDKPATCQFHHSKAVSIPDRLKPYCENLSMVVITRKQTAAMVSHACSVSLPESPPSHSVGNPTDTSE
ncbi:hypothetical protein KI387_007676, partial [Taxus chinensis]